MRCRTFIIYDSYWGETNHNFNYNYKHPQLPSKLGGVWVGVYLFGWCKINMTWCWWSSCWRAWSIRASKRHWPTQFAYTKLKISYKCRKMIPCCPCKTFFSLSICFRFNLESWSIFRLRAAFGSFKKLFSSRRTSSRFDASAILFLNSLFRRSIS